MPDNQFWRYAREAAAFARSNELGTRYPERVLQELDQLWMTAFPSTDEALLYPANRRYVAELLDRTGSLWSWFSTASFALAPTRCGGNGPRDVSGVVYVNGMRAVNRRDDKAAA